jgi:hypothetical protein
MAEKPVTIRRARIGKKIGLLDDSDIARLNIALAFVIGLADRLRTQAAGRTKTGGTSIERQLVADRRHFVLDVY